MPLETLPRPFLHRSRPAKVRSPQHCPRPAVRPPCAPWKVALETAGAAVLVVLFVAAAVLA